MKRACLLPALLAAMIPSGAFALGIRIADQDAHATARGNAFVATADNPSAIYYNPAGITQLEGFHTSVGVYAITYKSEYAGASGQFETKNKPQAVPQIYSTAALKNLPLTFGLGLYSPYGLALEWPGRPGFRDQALQGRISYLTVHPVVAWRLHPTLSIGAGPTINYGETRIRRGLGTAPTDVLEFNGDDTDVGFTVGVLWQPHEQHSFGVSYRNAGTLDFQGASSINEAFPAFLNGTSTANARFPFPQHIVLGWSYRPTPQWNLEFNVDWTDWDRLQTVVLNQPGNAFVPAVPITFNWDSSFFYEWGVTRHFENGWRASGGYIFSENSVPDATFSPVVPDSDRHIFSLGVGQSRERLHWDVAYQFAWGPGRVVSRGGAAAAADGRYEFQSHALTFSIRYAF
jgi:long-chain fatty acid transport protein